MNLAINKQESIKAKHTHSLKNLEGEEVIIEARETVLLMSLTDPTGSQYMAIKKRTKGLVLLPFSLFLSFNHFKQEV